MTKRLFITSSGLRGGPPGEGLREVIIKYTCQLGATGIEFGDSGLLLSPGLRPQLMNEVLNRRG